MLGKVHPSINKDDIYVAEISLTKLNKTIKPIKYKESSKYPEITKDMAFIVNDNITSGEILEQIKRTGGRLLSNVSVFDVYKGENVGENEKSIAYKLTFEDPNRTLSDEEVTVIFKKIIEEVEKKFEAKLRDK